MRIFTYWLFWNFIAIVLIFSCFEEKPSAAFAKYYFPSLRMVAYNVFGSWYNLLVLHDTHRKRKSKTLTWSWQSKHLSLDFPRYAFAMFLVDIWINHRYFGWALCSKLNIWGIELSTHIPPSGQFMGLNRVQAATCHGGVFGKHLKLICLLNRMTRTQCGGVQSAYERVTHSHSARCKPFYLSVRNWRCGKNSCSN